MGGSSSTRRITVVNDESTGVIKISDSVVNRLRGQFDEKKEYSEKDETDKPNNVTAPVQLPVTPPPMQVPSPMQMPMQIPNKNSVREEYSNKNLRDNDLHVKGSREHYWREKFRELEKRHAGILKQTTDEFNRGLQTVEELFSNPTVTGICEEVEAKVYECYKNNPHSSLDCSRQVQAFADCVQAFRLRTLVAKG